MSEEWRDIEGAPDYQVSDQGRVRSRKRGKWKVLGNRPCRRYFSVQLRIKGESKSFLVHRLVLEAFVGACPPGCETRHLNGDPVDNRLCNLTWGTRRENIADKVRHGTVLRGEEQPIAKLSDADALEIRRVYQYGMGSALAEQYGVVPSVISSVITGRSFGHLPGAEKFSGKGERHPWAKLTEIDVREIRILVGQGYTQTELAGWFGIDQSTVSAIVTRKTWKHVE